MLAAIPAATLFRNASVGSPENQDIGYLEKYQWGSDYDILLAGNSMVNRGLNPDQFNVAYPGAKTGNYAFSNQGYSDAYIQSLESKFRPGSTGRILVLGLSPGSLADHAMKLNGFNIAANTAASLRFPEEARVRNSYKKLVIFFAPTTPSRLFRRFNFDRSDDFSYFSHAHANGWIAADRQPHDHGAVLRETRNANIFDPPLEDRIQVMKTKIREWRQQGIQVYAFWPPEDRSIRVKAEHHAGYTEKEWGKIFSDSGAVWLSAPCEDYETYDGIHLPPDQARKLTAEIIRQIQSFSAGA